MSETVYYELDEARYDRIGMSEAVYCKDKDFAILNDIISFITKKNIPAIFTKISKEQEVLFADDIFEFNSIAKTALFRKERTKYLAKVGILTGGTSDLSIAHEARETLKFYGVKSEIISDIGVAGLHRLLDKKEAISKYDVLIVCAGWDAALASVAGGLFSAPIIGVPVSSGYGSAHSGVTAQNSMLSSCSQGLCTVNIDNGFGAACAAIRIIRMTDSCPKTL